MEEPRFDWIVSPDSEAWLARDFSSRRRAASRLKACSGTKRMMNGTRIPEKMATNPKGHRNDLLLSDCLYLNWGNIHSIGDYTSYDGCQEGRTKH